MWWNIILHIHPSRSLIFALLSFGQTYNFPMIRGAIPSSIYLDDVIYYLLTQWINSDNFVN